MLPTTAQRGVRRHDVEPRACHGACHLNRREAQPTEAEHEVSKDAVLSVAQRHSPIGYGGTGRQVLSGTSRGI